MYSRRINPYSCLIVNFYNLIMSSAASCEVCTGAAGYEEIWDEEKGVGDLGLIEDAECWDMKGRAREKKAGRGRCTNFSTQGLGCFPLKRITTWFIYFEWFTIGKCFHIHYLIRFPSNKKVGLFITSLIFDVQNLQLDIMVRLVG